MRKQVRYHHICEDEHSLMDKDHSPSAQPYFEENC